MEKISSTSSTYTERTMTISGTGLTVEEVARIFNCDPSEIIAQNNLVSNIIPDNMPIYYTVKTAKSSIAVEPPYVLPRESVL